MQPIMQVISRQIIQNKTRQNTDPEERKPKISKNKPLNISVKQCNFQYEQ
jgi:hypothetical protein